MLELLTVGQALRALGPVVRKGTGKPMMVRTEDALGRVLAHDVLCPDDLPPFPRSAVDGYAVRAADTFGASEALPAYLRVVADVEMGVIPGFSIKEGEAVRMPTGGALPSGADAVVMVEYCEEIGDGTVLVGSPVAPGENVIQKGEDAAAGSVLLREGHRLRPQDIGALEGAGICEVEVYPRPRIAVISTGDEIVPPQSIPSPGQIRDVNGGSLCASLLRDGCLPEFLGVVRDESSEVIRVIREALRYDAIILSGGSSAGARDMVASCIDSLGKPGVLVHGLALRPGKPTMAGAIGDTPVIGLPGHPTSALVAYEVFARPLLERLSGESGRACDGASGRFPVRAIVSRSISSKPGREEYIRCALRRADSVVWADPVLGKSGLISTMVKANSFIHVPLDRDGYGAGEAVDVYLFD